MYRSNCTGCKYYCMKPSKFYRAIVEGCSRQDWEGVSLKNSGDTNRISCYVPSTPEEGRTDE